MHKQSRSFILSLCREVFLKGIYIRFVTEFRCKHGFKRGGTSLFYFILFFLSTDFSNGVFQYKKTRAEFSMESDFSSGITPRIHRSGDFKSGSRLFMRKINKNKRNEGNDFSRSLLCREMIISPSSPTVVQISGPSRASPFRP